MEISTQYFGKISCSEKEFIHFSDGLFGFADLKNYVPLAFQENSDALICLQSIDNLSVSFILMNPFQFYEKYEPELSQEDQKLLKASDGEDKVSYYVISVIQQYGKLKGSHCGKYGNSGSQTGDFRQSSLPLPSSA